MIDPTQPTSLDKRDYRLGNSMAGYRQRRIESWLLRNPDLDEVQEIKADRAKLWAQRRA